MSKSKSSTAVFKGPAAADIVAALAAPRKSAIGACVRYCGHNATFVADITEVAGACVIRANGPIDKVLTRPADGETHHVSDFPVAGFWRPDLGVLVVPSSQVTPALYADG